MQGNPFVAGPPSDLIAQPPAKMSHLYAWLGLSSFQIDPQKPALGAQESDSRYRVKYCDPQ